jgi:hypothetical protein
MHFLTFNIMLLNTVPIWRVTRPLRQIAVKNGKVGEMNENLLFSLRSTYSFCLWNWDDRFLDQKCAGLLLWPACCPTLSPIDIQCDLLYMLYIGVFLNFTS